MLRIYKFGKGQGSEILDASDLRSALKSETNECFWIDLLDPAPSLVQKIEQVLAIDIPTQEEVRLREFSNRFYREKDWTIFTFSLLAYAEKSPVLTPVTFLNSDRYLVTLRYHDLTAFKSFHAHLHQGFKALENPQACIFRLLDEIAARLSDLSVKLDANLDLLSRKIFAPRNSDAPHDRPDLRAALHELGSAGDLCSKIRESLASLQHCLLWLRQMDLGGSEKEEAQRLENDFQSIGQHDDFIVNKLTFLLDATLGFINLEQNQTIKIFSVLAVIFLPPTLIASIYGMNFQNMPELHWWWGYPMAIATMVLSAVVSFWVFKSKRWL